MQIGDLDPELFELALKDTIKCYACLQDSCRILDFEELEYVPGTSPGFKYKVAGCSNKEDALSAFRQQLKRSWDEHHVRRVPCLWKQAGKVELLKREKVTAGDLRGFTCPELDFLFCCMRMNHDFNKKLHTFAHNFMATMSRVGYVLQKGGFTRIFQRHHRPGCKCGEGDCEKFDSDIAALFYYVSMMVRYDAWDKKGMSTQEWFDRQKWYFENKCYSFIVLPSGQIVFKIIGNNSGQESTTDDNGIAHSFTLCYIWRKLFRMPLWACLDSVNIDLYADDHLFSVPPKFDQFADYETRRRLYLEVGLHLSKAKDLVTQNTAVGHTFLGPKAVMSGGRLVPVYNRDKVLCSVLFMEHEFPPDVQLGRVLSIMLNCVFDRPVFDYLRAYAFHLRELAHGALTLPDAVENVSFLWLLSIPSAREVETFWLGTENHS